MIEQLQYAERVFVGSRSSYLYIFIHHRDCHEFRDCCFSALLARRFVLNDMAGGSGRLWRCC